MKAKAAVLFEVGQRLDIREVDVQAPRAGEVLIRMAAGGVCHSDLHAMTGHLVVALPAILGHEGAGVVADVGPGVTSVKPGDHVIPLWRLSCGVCEYCSDGRPALCNAGMQVRMTGRLPDGTTRFSLDGKEIKHFAGVSTFSEYSVVPEGAVLKIPPELPLDRAALLGCAVITGVGAVINCARVRPGSSVVVFGTGGVGLNAVQGARIAGAEKIVAVDLLDRKLEFAKKFGATHTVNAAQGDPVAQVRALTGGRGVDYAFEVIGLPKTIRQAYDCLAKRGMAVVVGVTPMTTEVAVPVMSLVFEERVLTGSIYGSSRPRIDIPKLIDLYRAGTLKLDELLTRTYPFKEINEAYAALERGEVARSVVTF
ncbi:MAG: alcohol dehydrogenase [Candidatus Rokubacteria bacterium 13_1_40CM_69_27]|nr:MAG: alcohol dehydrogenase [Candidatus Rokubacteria bacterium 13_1_40CM_69_27]OLC32474.1 MAG: alcohol dehydrogenase [Candidatus Rokubacteria bacterium 13_1_40CM_4_69_5]